MPSCAIYTWISFYFLLLTRIHINVTVTAFDLTYIQEEETVATTSLLFRRHHINVSSSPLFNSVFFTLPFVFLFYVSALPFAPTYLKSLSFLSFTKAEFIVKETFTKEQVYCLILTTKKSTHLTQL